jgi:hypothetical protein
MLTPLKPVPSKPREWPNVPAERGKFYALPDPIHIGTKLVVMSEDTWVDFGTVLEKQRRMMAQQDAEIRKLQGASGALASQLNDLQGRHSNLMDAYKKMKRGKLEAMDIFKKEPI